MSDQPLDADASPDAEDVPKDAAGASSAVSALLEKISATDDPGPKVSFFKQKDRVIRVVIAIVAAAIFIALIARPAYRSLSPVEEKTIPTYTLFEAMLDGIKERHQRNLKTIESDYEQAIADAENAVKNDPEYDGVDPSEIERAEPETFVIHTPKFEVTDSMIKLIGELDDSTRSVIDTVIVDQGIVSDEGLKAICTLPNLQHLRLRLSPISDEGMQLIAQCPKLWFLNLPHSTCTMAGVESLKISPMLRQLRIGSSNLDNEASRAITQIKTLRGIHLIGIPITNAGMRSIAEMKYLESLYMDDSAVTEAGWSWLYETHPELHVHVNQRHLDRDPKKHFHH